MVVSLTLACGLQYEVASDVAALQAGKVEVCHIPPGNPSKAHTLEVSPSAVNAHLNHGDYRGACDLCPVGTTGPCYSGPPSTEGVGACHAGTQYCVNGSAWGACTGEVLPSAETCGNAIDDDCDGGVDEDCICVPNSSASCYGGPAGTEGIGVCAAGTRVCDASGASYGDCLGQVLPATETCGNGLDDDCDGVVDDSCVCVPGTTESCYAGASGTQGVGVCQAGTRTCNGAGTGWGTCTGEVLPDAETCNDMLDNDCDGVVNDSCVCTPGSRDTCYTGPTETAGVGVCSAGTRVCNADGTAYGVCEGEVLPAPEVCGDAFDNDCDGTVDETCFCTPGSTAYCYSGSPDTADVGICRSGLRTCNAAGSAYGPCEGEVLPAAEVCGNTLDNDCDGVVGDGCICAPGQSSACYEGPAGTAGVGQCRTGTAICNAAGTGFNSCEGDVTPSPEICGDDVDNDCDGQTDEGCLGDRVWNDRNRDGIQDAGEAGLGGATLILRTTNGALVAVAVSAASGTYAFQNVPPGTYYIELIPPFSYTLSAADSGVDDTVDNDFDGETGATTIFTYSGLEDSSWDAGCYFVIQN